MRLKLPDDVLYSRLDLMPQLHNCHPWNRSINLGDRSFRAGRFHHSFFRRYDVFCKYIKGINNFSYVLFLGTRATSALFWYSNLRVGVARGFKMDSRMKFPNAVIAARLIPFTGNWLRAGKSRRGIAKPSVAALLLTCPFIQLKISNRQWWDTLEYSLLAAIQVAWQSGCSRNLSWT